MQDANTPFSQQHPEIHSGGKPGSMGRSLGTPDNKQEKEKLVTSQQSMGAMQGGEVLGGTV